MATKRDIKRLLKQGLSGFEAGRLFIQHAWNVDRRQEGILTETEKALIRQSLKSRRDIETFYHLNDTYNIVWYAMKEAHIQTLKILLDLERLNHIADSHYIEWLDKNFKPPRMTEKQYQETLQGLKDRQKQKKLKDLYCLYEVICQRAYQIASLQIPEDQMPDTDQFMDVDYPEIYKRAEAQIVELIEAGKLKPIKLSHKASTKFDQPDGYDVSSFFPDRELDAEEEEKLLQTYFSGEMLYEAGLPEWIERIEEYWEGYGERDPFKFGVALIKNPNSYQLDENGYYKEPSYRIDLPEDSLQRTLQSAKQLIKEFLAYLDVFGKFSKFVGVNFIDDLLIFWEDITGEVEAYNRKVTEVIIELEGRQFEADLTPKAFGLPAIHINRLKPDKESVAILKKHLSTYLGSSWYDCQQEQEGIDGQETEPENRRYGQGNTLY